ncbi:MAG: uroporphyrinogen decarboxylase family protein [Promethearchaeota archaeon]
MNARERYLAVYDDSKRKKLDRVPTFVQYIREEFILKNSLELLNKFNINIIKNNYFKVPYLIGFDSIFATFPLSVKIKNINIKNENGRIIKIGENGQAKIQKTNYYEGGYIHSLDILGKLRQNMKKVDRSPQIKHLISYYEKISDYIFPILTLDGIFDRVWKAMGWNLFSRHFHKKTMLYRELIKFYAKIAKINVKGLINIINGKGKVITFLDDVAFKGHTMISPKRWEQDFLLYYKEINSLILDAGFIPQIHTDGDATQLIPLFQKAGFLGLQGWEGGCDPFYINDHFPNFVVIGFVDVNEILPFGSKEKIEAHVKDLMDALKENRHFIIGPSTVIFEKIPLKNVKIFLSAVKKFGKY